MISSRANQIGLKNPDVKEESGKLRITGQTEHQLDADHLWDNIKTHAGWENEIVANIQAQCNDIFGVHTVVAGDTLSNPDLIKVGQRLNIPAR